MRILQFRSTSLMAVMQRQNDNFVSIILEKCFKIIVSHPRDVITPISPNIALWCSSSNNFHRSDLYIGSLLPLLRYHAHLGLFIAFWYMLFCCHCCFIFRSGFLHSFLQSFLHSLSPNLSPGLTPGFLPKLTPKEIIHYPILPNIHLYRGLRV